MFHCSHNKSLDTNVYNLQNTYSLCLWSVPIDGSHKQLWVRWQPYCRYFQIFCARTPRQCLKFKLWISCISLSWHVGFWNGFKVFGKLLTSAIVCTCDSSSIQNSLWKQREVLYSVWWLIAVPRLFETFNFPYLFKGMFQNAFHIAL